VSGVGVAQCLDPILDALRPGRMARSLVRARGCPRRLYGIGDVADGRTPRKYFGSSNGCPDMTVDPSVLPLPGIRLPFAARAERDLRHTVTRYGYAMPVTDRESTTEPCARLEMN